MQLFVAFLFGTQHQDSIHIAQFLVITAAFHIFVNCINSFYAANRIHHKLYFNHLNILALKIITLTFAYPFGIAGLTIATMIATLTSTGIITWQFCKKT